MARRKIRRALDEILEGKHPDYNRTHIRPRLIKEKILEEVCNKCGSGPIWKGESLSLQLDHINGVNDDHRLENLQLLCPNCHSQTSTFAGRNRRINH